jgi:hypothetical protein
MINPRYRLYGPLLAISFVLIVATAMRIRGEPSIVGIGDWFALWSGPVIARAQGAAAIYDMATVHAAQTALGLAAHKYAGFPYPPTFLAMIWPFGSLSIGMAFAAWMAVTFTLYMLVFLDRPGLHLVALVPASIGNFLAGQNGFLCGAIILGGLRLLKPHPLLAGALLGATFKPTIGILLPVALIASRQWLCLASAAVTTLVLALGTVLVFGADAWVAWVNSMSAFVQGSAARSQIDYLSQTVAAALRQLGVEKNIAFVGQAFAGLTAAAVVWRVWRRFDVERTEPAILTLCAATFLAAPHALFYDLTILGGAIALYLRARGNETLRSFEIVMLLLGVGLPMIHGFPLGPLVMCGLIWIASKSSTAAPPAATIAMSNAVRARRACDLRTRA